MANDIFAPPTPDELKSAQVGRTAPDLFAPPTKDEIIKATAPPGGDPPDAQAPASNVSLLSRRGLVTPDREDIQGLGQITDQLGGPVRMGLASVAGLATGKGQIITPKDIIATQNGEGPKSAEYMQRLGVPAGPNLKDTPYVGQMLPDVNLRDAAGFVSDVVTDPLSHAAKGVAAANPTGALTERAGQSVYKSGLKNLDLAAAKSGKAPVSDLLMANRVTGNSEQIFKQMDNLGQQLLEGRNDILKKATRAGAEVDMNKAIAKAQDYVNELRKTDNPEAREAVGMLQARINDYLGASAKEPQKILKELPVSSSQVPLDPSARLLKTTEAVPQKGFIKPISRDGQLYYDAPTLSAPANGAESFSMNDLVRKDAGPNARFKFKPSENVIRDGMDSSGNLPAGSDYQTKVSRPAPYEVAEDMTERVPGPTPTQTSSWKSSAASKVGDVGYQVLAKTSEGRVFNKALASGLRDATQESVGKAIGRDAADELARKNSQIASILSSDEKAYSELEKEARRLGFTSVDGMLATHPYMLVTKKVADIAKTTAARTKVGLVLQDVARSGLLDPAVRRGLINQTRKKGILEEPQGGLMQSKEGE